MTSQTNRNGRSFGQIVLVALAAGALIISGCEEKKKPPPPPPPAPPPRVEAPKPVDIAAVLQELKSDARVKFPDTQSPADRSLAEGVIKLANAIVKGDTTTMKSMLDKPGQQVLDELTGSGQWAEETKSIEQVRIVAVSSTSERQASTSLVGMAIQAPGGAYLLAWNGHREGSNWVFSAAPSQNDSRPRASDFDGVRIMTTGFGSVDETPGLRPESSTGGAPKPADPAKAPPPTDGPKKKSTPAGPITIPGGG